MSAGGRLVKPERPGVDTVTAASPPPPPLPRSFNENARGIDVTGELSDAYVARNFFRGGTGKLDIFVSRECLRSILKCTNDAANYASASRVYNGPNAARRRAKKVENRERKIAEREAQRRASLPAPRQWGGDAAAADAQAGPADDGPQAAAGGVPAPPPKKRRPSGDQRKCGLCGLPGHQQTNQKHHPGSQPKSKKPRVEPAAEAGGAGPATPAAASAAIFPGYA